MSKSEEMAALLVGGVPSTLYSRPTYLMCSPEWYDVDYVINPWMAGNLHRSTRDAAFQEWKGLYSALKQVADVKLLHPHRGSPDMTFVAHAAVVNHGVAALSSFAHAERQSEETYLRHWLEDAGFLIWETPRETCFEGEGDALFDANGRHLWLAHGARTCRYSHRHIADAFHVGMHTLHLVDPRFYHLDTCFAPLSGGHLLYFPDAFDSDSRALIEACYPAEMRIAVTEMEAAHFACNLLNLGPIVLMHHGAPRVAERLTAQGYRVTQLPLHEFLRGGGSAKSLALRLSDLSITHAA